MNRGAVIERVRRLQALAQSPTANVHEAANAAQHADRLIAEHQITADELRIARKPERAAVPVPVPDLQTALFDLFDELAAIGRAGKRRR